MEKRTIYAALAALVGLVYLFKKSGSNTTTATPFVVGPATPATSAVTGAAPIIIVAPSGVSASDATVSNPAPAPVASQGFTIGGVATGTAAPDYLPTPATAVTADSQFANQTTFDEYQRRVQGLGW